MILDIIMAGLTFLVASIFVFYGVSKMLAPALLFERNIESYSLLPSRFVKPFARTLPIIEVVAGLLLLFATIQIIAAIVLGVLLLVFEGAIAMALHKHLTISCGCKSGIETSNKTLRWSFGRNLVLLAILVVQQTYYFLAGHNTGEPFLYSLVSGLVLVGVASFWEVRMRPLLYYKPGELKGSTDSSGITTAISRRGFAKFAMIAGVGTLGLFTGLSNIKIAAAYYDCGPDYECACNTAYIVLYCFCNCDCGAHPCTYCYCREQETVRLSCCGGPNSGRICGEYQQYTGNLIYCTCCQGFGPNGQACC